MGRDHDLWGPRIGGRPRVTLGFTAKHVVLVGAGLSRNWGGYLASEMWAAILSHTQIETRDRLRRLLLEQTDFELALAEVELSGAYSYEERGAMRAAVRAAYDEHDRNLCHSLTDETSRGVWLDFCDMALRPLMDGRASKGGGASFLFSLNQDLLLERALPRVSGVMPPKIPGLPLPANPWFPSVSSQPHLRELSDGDKIYTLAGLKLDGVGENCLNIIKLHGSVNWHERTPHLFVNDVLVLGGGKAATIDRFPLLRAYHDIFSEVLMSGDVRLLVIGYSFRDPHINKVIGEAAEAKGLKLFIVDPRPPRELSGALADSGDSPIWSGIVGFLNRPIRESFGPTGGSSTRSGEARRLYDHFYR